jgi:hypothetical protein
MTLRAGLHRRQRGDVSRHPGGHDRRRRHGPGRTRSTSASDSTDSWKGTVRAFLLTVLLAGA